MSSLPDPDQSAKMEEKIIIAVSAYPVIFNTGYDETAMIIFSSILAV